MHETRKPQPQAIRKERKHLIPQCLAHCSPQRAASHVVALYIGVRTAAKDTRAGTSNVLYARR
eukprot:9448341-Pyramimonas_sp.AAC.1